MCLWDSSSFTGWKEFLREREYWKCYQSGTCYKTCKIRTSLSTMFEVFCYVFISHFMFDMKWYRWYSSSKFEIYFLFCYKMKRCLHPSSSQIYVGVNRTRALVFCCLSTPRSCLQLRKESGKLKNSWQIAIETIFPLKYFSWKGGRVYITLGNFILCAWLCSAYIIQGFWRLPFVLGKH